MVLWVGCVKFVGWGFRLEGCELKVEGDVGV